jgi:CubicO group peptidase (beta-lactamase class C family)
VHANETGLYGPGAHVFGHNGWGGSFGCADTRADIAIGYVMNQMGEGILGDVRGRALCNAVYACLWRGGGGGAWCLRPRLAALK